MSPNDVEVMIHYYGSPLPHPRIDAPAVRSATDRLLEAKLIVPSESREPNTYEATGGGVMYIKALCAVPFPVRSWVMPSVGTGAI